MLEAVVLTCAACGAPVPAGDASELPCPACGALVRLPEDQRRARETAEQHAELDAEAARLAERIGDAPAPALRALTLFEGGCALYLLFPLFIIAGFFVARAALRLIGPLTSRQLAEDDRYLTMGSFGAAIAMFGIGLLGATYAGRRLAGLRELQAGLSARLPERAGGPSSCRLCGAELAFAAGARAVRCRYCSAENLTAIDPGWLRLAKHAKDQRAVSLSDAWVAHRTEADRLRRSFRARAIGVAVVGGGLLLLTGTLIFSVPPRAPETPYDRWAKEAEVPRLILERAYVGRASDAGLWPLLSRTACDRPGRGIVKTFRFAPMVCKPGAHCNAPWYVALRAGDVVHLETNGSPPGLVLFFPHSDEPPFSKAGRGALIGKGTLQPGSPIELQAPRDGWYLIIYAIEDASPDTDYDLCAQLIREPP